MFVIYLFILSMLCYFNHLIHANLLLCLSIYSSIHLSIPVSVYLYQCCILLLFVSCSCSPVPYASVGWLFLRTTPCYPRPLNERARLRV